MRNKKGIVGMLAFVGCLWVVVVVSYAAQTKEIGKGFKTFQAAQNSCSGSSSGPE